MNSVYRKVLFFFSSYTLEIKNNNKYVFLRKELMNARMGMK